MINDLNSIVLIGSISLMLLIMGFRLLISASDEKDETPFQNIFMVYSFMLSIVAFFIMVSYINENYNREQLVNDKINYITTYYQIDKQKIKPITHEEDYDVFYIDNQTNIKEITVTNEKTFDKYLIKEK